jgi:hypothetical protein
MKYLIIFLAFVASAKKSLTQVLDDGRIIKIPVVFHVIYSDRSHEGRNDKGNTSENISTHLLLNELADLNRDFLLLNTDTSEVIPAFKKIIGNAKIEFYQADTILQTGGEKGIIRIDNSRNRSKLYNRSKIVNPRKYLNVYIGAIGGSFAPSATPWVLPDKDAVYLGFDWVGLRYRLLTHEVGHWLGLLHVFGGSGGAKGDFCKGTGDDISDTPPQATSTDQDCDLCPPVVKDQSCNSDNSSNFNNYMDYSGCRKMFTIEQVKAMRDNLKNFRNELWNNTK